MGIEPSQIRAGDTVAWTTAVSTYPATSGWELTYFLAKPSVEPILITAIAEGDAHRVQVDAATTATWLPGQYHWTVTVSKGTERYTLDSGMLEILPDPTAVHDPRHPLEIELDNVRKTLSILRSSHNAEYEIEGTKAKQREIEELERQEARLASRLRRKRGGSLMTAYPVRLG